MTYPWPHPAERLSRGRRACELAALAPGRHRRQKKKGNRGVLPPFPRHGGVARRKARQFRGEHIAEHPSIEVLKGCGPVWVRPARVSAGDRFPIVGIGASAGGVEALEGFFRGLPGQPGFAFVIVTHLSPDRESLLQRSSAASRACRSGSPPTA